MASGGADGRVFAVGAAAVLTTNWLMAGMPIIQVPPVRWVLLRSAGVSLLDVRHGLMPFVPWALVAAGGVAVGLRPGARAPQGAAAWAVAGTCSCSLASVALA